MQIDKLEISLARTGEHEIVVEIKDHTGEFIYANKLHCFTPLVCLKARLR